MSVKKLTKTFQIVYVVLFAVIVGVPVFAMGFDLVKDIESTEQRRMSPKPSIDSDDLAESLKQYPQGYEDYLNDNFPARNRIIKQYSKIRTNLFFNN